MHTVGPGERSPSGALLRERGGVFVRRAGFREHAGDFEPFHDRRLGCYRLHIRSNARTHIRGVCAESLIRVDDVVESLKLAE
jgi:hypothetical protein